MVVLGRLDVEWICGREERGVHRGGHLDVVGVPGGVLCPHVQTGVGGRTGRPRVGGYDHGLDGKRVLLVHVIQVCQVHGLILYVVAHPGGGSARSA